MMMMMMMTAPCPHRLKFDPADIQQKPETYILSMKLFENYVHLYYVVMCLRGRFVQRFLVFFLFTKLRDFWHFYVLCLLA